MKEGLKILSWAEEDRPREKLLLKGRSALSDAELIAILIGSGTPAISAVDLSKIILAHANNDLNQLARFSVTDLQTFRGIGEAKAISIISALELGRRRKETIPSKRPRIKSSRDVYEVMKSELLDQPVEQFWVLMLSRSNQVIHKRAISLGGVSGTIADPKIIFKRALEDLASSIVLVHNHPSGNPQPSKSDMALTKKLQQSGRLLEIPVVDHLIFTDEDYFSFADEGMM